MQEPTVLAAAFEKEGSLPALGRATLLRWSTGQPKEVAADVERFLSALTRLATSPSLTPADRAAAEDFFQDVLDVKSWPDTDLWFAVMPRFIAALHGNQLTALRFRAEIALAAQLWLQSCPVPGEDGACVARLHAEPSCRQAQAAVTAELHRQQPARRVLVAQPASPHYAYRVFPRSALAAQKAQRLLAEALRRLGPVQLQRVQPGDALDEAVAHAYFLRAEPEFEAALALPLWPGAPATLNPDPFPYCFEEFPLGTALSRKRIKVWLRQRGIGYRQVKQQAAYALVLSHPQTRWALAAQTRIGQLFLDFSDQTNGCATPRLAPLRTPGARHNDNECYKEGDSMEEGSIEYRARHWLGECDTLARERLLDDPYVTLCRELLAEIGPQEWPGAYEISPAPLLLGIIGLTTAPPL